jgi:hypothetical protein
VKLEVPNVLLGKAETTVINDLSKPACGLKSKKKKPKLRQKP